MRSIVWRRIKLVGLALFANGLLVLAYISDPGPAAVMAALALPLLAYIGAEVALGPSAETLEELHRRWERYAIIRDIRRGQPFEYAGRLWHHADSPLWQPLPPVTTGATEPKEGDACRN